MGNVVSEGALFGFECAIAFIRTPFSFLCFQFYQSRSQHSYSSRSFAIIAAPYGLSTTFYISLTDGTSVTVLWGWVLVSLISLCIAASLGEICAVYPTAGGVYYWSAMLSTKKYAPITSWVTGWLTLVGNWTVTTSINFGGAQLILCKFCRF